MPPPSPDRVADWPLWWFARLESALERGDDRAAAAAVRKLEQLGIEVRFLVPPGRAGRRVAAEAPDRQRKGVGSGSR
jgi:hypothetical protein